MPSSYHDTHACPTPGHTAFGSVTSQNGKQQPVFGSHFVANEGSTHNNPGSQAFTNSQGSNA